MIDAKEARRLLENEFSLVVKTEMKEIEKGIAKSLSKGEANYFTRIPLHSTTVKKVKELGYKVETYDNSDPRDMSTDRGHIISW